MKEVPPARLKFLDESGCNLSLTRSYGWARCGEPCVGRVPGNSGVRQSIVALFSHAGVESHHVQAGSLKQADFTAFVREFVAPRLSPGDVVVVDNARCHHGKGAREAIEAAGARLVFLPAYSPDLAPIELGWRQIKAFLRQVGPRTAEALLAAIAQAMPRVTPRQAAEYFTRCGYQALQTE
jgi:transposase